MPKLTFKSDELGFDSIPDGRYHVIFTDGEVRTTGDESKNPGAEYWNGEVTVQDGPFAGRKDWINFMLPPYQPFALGGLAVALGFDKDDLMNGKVEVELYEEQLEDPEGDDCFAIVGSEVIMTVKTKTKDGNANRNHRFFAFDPDEWEPEESDDSTLP